MNSPIPTPAASRVSGRPSTACCAPLAYWGDAAPLTLLRDALTQPGKRAD